MLLFVVDWLLKTVLQKVIDMDHDHCIHLGVFHKGGKGHMTLKFSFCNDSQLK